MTVKLDYCDHSWSDTFGSFARGIRNRPLVLLGPYSYLGGIYGREIVKQCGNVVGAVDDHCQDALIHGVPRWTSEEFRVRAPRINGLVGVDFARSSLGHAMSASLIGEAGIERADFVEVNAELGILAVYQPPREMRDRTMMRQTEWTHLRSRLADDASRATLDSILLLRLTYDRRHLNATMTGPEHEYFTTHANGGTFRLGNDEIVADCGAYIGETVRKAISATGGQFRAIHAFEPDRRSFAKLEKLRDLGNSNIILHNIAVGEKTGFVRFLETGTTASHVDEATGNTEDTPVARLDDVLDEVTFIKMDLEGYEKRGLQGASRLIRECRPRMAITGYHYADDLLDLWKTFEELAPGYEIRLRHHYSYYWDTIFYAMPR